MSVLCNPIISSVGAMWSEVWQQKWNVYEISPDFVASREIMAKELDSQSAETWLGGAWF